MVDAFEGNDAETTTTLRTIRAFLAARRSGRGHRRRRRDDLREEHKGNRGRRLSFILGMCLPEVPLVIGEWQREHPGEPIPDGHVLVQPWSAESTDKRNDQMRYYQYEHGRARRTFKSIDEQVGKAEQG